MTADIERDQAPAVGPYYRINEVLGGWELQYQDPCRHRWHGLALRDTFSACVAAYERICQGETVEYDG